MFKNVTLNLLSKRNTEPLCFARKIQVCCTKSVNNVEWKERRRIPVNPNCNSLLKDKPDFEFADGKPSPYNIQQRIRIYKQMEIGKQVIELLKKVNFCKAGYQKVIQDQEQQTQNYLKKKLKPKGIALLAKRGRKTKETK